MGPFSNSVGAAAFWLFIAVVALAGIIKSILQHRETQKTIRQAIEHGQPFDETLLQADKPWEAGQGAKAETPANMILGGLIVIASGLGLGVLGFFIGLEEGHPVYPLFGIGVMTVLVGIPIAGFGAWSLSAQRRANRGS